MVFSSNLGLVGMPVPMLHVLPCFSFVSWCRAWLFLRGGPGIHGTDTSSISIRKYWDVKYGWLPSPRNPALDCGMTSEGIITSIDSLDRHLICKF